MGVLDYLPGLGGGDEDRGTDDTGDSTASNGAVAVNQRFPDITPRDFGERAEKLAARSDVPSLDFTVDTLDHLDELTAGPPNPVDDVLTYGSYLGETLVREFDGEWTQDDDWQVAVDLSDDVTTVAVFDAARMAIENDPVFVRVADRLEAEGAVRARATPHRNRRKSTVNNSPSDHTDGSVVVDSPASVGTGESDDATDLEEPHDQDDTVGSAENTDPDGGDVPDSIADDENDDPLDAAQTPLSMENGTRPDALGPDESGLDAESDDEDAVNTIRTDVTDETDPDKAETATDETETDKVETDETDDAPGRYLLRDAADEFVTNWPDRDLNVTPESLPELDAFVDDQWDGRFRAATLRERTVEHENSSDSLTQLGAYYGEVLVRWLDGEWVGSQDGEGAVAVPDVGERVERIFVFDAARECLTEPSSFAYRFDALVNRLHVDRPAVSEGKGELYEGDVNSLTSGDVITQFAEEADALVARWPEYQLDYEPFSLRYLEDLVRNEYLAEGFSDVNLADGTDPDSLRLTALATTIGAYFAVVLVRNCDAQWRIEDDVELVIAQAGEEATVDPVTTAAACLRDEDSFVRTYEQLRK